MAAFLVSDRTGGNYELSLADGGVLPVQAIPNTGGGGSGVGELIFPNIAAMAAFDVTTIPGGPQTGQQAFVQSNGSVWTLSGATVTPDGITVVDGTPAPAQWKRENIAGYLPLALAQTVWYVDPQNVETTSSDENDGLTPATALLHKAEIFRRWASLTPTLDGIVVQVHYLSSDINGDGGGNDPWLARPNFPNGAQLVHISALPAAGFTGTLLAVTAKNRAGNQALESTFTVGTGAIATGMKLVNASRGGSVAFVHRSPVAGTWLLTQPMVAYNPSGFPFAAPVEVDTWANGDAITGYNLTLVDIATLGGQSVGAVPGFAGPSHMAYNVTILDPTGGEPATLDMSGAVSPQLVECYCQRSPSINVVSVLPPQISNVYVKGFGFYNLGGCTFAGGAIVVTIGQAGSSNGQGIALDDDTIIDMGDTGSFFTMGFGGIAHGLYLDRGSLKLYGSTSYTGAAIVYGSGHVDQVEGASQGFGLAVTAFPCTGGLRIGSQTNAYSNLTTAGVVATAQLPLTPTALDAAAGPAGFGGLAYVPGVGAFYSGGALP